MKIIGNPTAEMILEAQRNEDERKRLSGAAVLAKTTARLGRVVCPVDPMTGPIHEDFEARATSNPDEVEKLWQGAPNALVGLPCSRNNVTVLHARGGQGIQSLSRLAARHGCFPADAKAVNTPYGGIDVHFRMPEGGLGTGLIAPGLYVVGHGGYAISDCSSVTNMPEGSPVDRFYLPQRPASGRAQLPDWVIDKAKSFLPDLPPPVGSDGFNVDLTQRDLEELAASYVVGATVELAVRRIGLPKSEWVSAGLVTPEGKFTPGPAPNPGDHSLKPFFKLWGGFVTPPGNDLHEPPPSPSVSFYDPWAELGGPAFPLETLPPFLKAFAQAASASAGMDASAYAIAGLSALAASIPATVRVHLGGEHYVRPNAWVALVGDPSCGKSPVIETCVKPLRKLDDDEARQHTVALGNWESAKRAASAQGLPAPPKPREPIAYVTDSMTPEAVAETLATQDRGLLAVADELVGWIGAMERTGKQGQNPDRAFWLRSYNGGPYSTRRIVRGRTRVNNLCVSVIGGVQPDVLKKLRGSITDDGLLQRFIPVIMRTKALGFGSSYASEAAAYARVLTNATTLPENLLISLDADAKGVFANLKRLTHDLEVDDTLAKGFRGFAGKLDKVFAFLCGALLLGDVKGAVTSPTMAVVDVSTARRADKIIRDFIIPHAYEVFGLTTNGVSDIDQVRAVGSFILTDSRERLRYTAGDFTAGVRGLRHCTRPDVFDAVAPLVAGSWLELEEPSLRREQRAYVLNPAVRPFFEERSKKERARKLQVQALIKANTTREN